MDIQDLSKKLEELVSSGSQGGTLGGSLEGTVEQLAKEFFSNGNFSADQIKTGIVTLIKNFKDKPGFDANSLLDLAKGLVSGATKGSNLSSSAANEILQFIVKECGNMGIDLKGLLSSSLLGKFKNFFGK